MPTRSDVASKLKEFIRDVNAEGKYEGYMGVYLDSGWVYDAPDGRKYARIVQGNEWSVEPCDLLDSTIADDYTQAVWVEYVTEGRMAITRKRIEGY